METYTEKQVMNAWYETMGRMWTTPQQGTLHSVFLAELKKKEPEMLFTKTEMLATAASQTDRILVHGIFGILGTIAADEEALHAKAAAAGHTNAMSVLIQRVRVKRGGQYEVGATYRSADNRLFRYTTSGFLQYTLSSASPVTPEEPLEKI